MRGKRIVRKALLPSNQDFDMNSFLRVALRQPSTWRGLVWIIAGVLGITLSDSDTNVLASAAMIIAFTAE